MMRRAFAILMVLHICDGCVIVISDGILFFDIGLQENLLLVIENNRTLICIIVYTADDLSLRGRAPSEGREAIFFVAKE